MVKLPFEAGLIVATYQAGNHIDIVVHGTIINETEWREAVIRTSMMQEYDVNCTLIWPDSLVCR